MQATQSLLDLTAADLMSHEVITIPQDMSPSVAAETLVQAQIGGAPVVDAAGRCVGVFSAAETIDR